MSRNNLHNSSGSIALNIFAVAFALMPLFTLGTFTYQTFFSDQRSTAQLAEIEADAAPELFEEPVISITFDDGWKSVYSEAAPLLSEHDIPTTQYILPGSFTDDQYISAEQALSLKKAGHEISSHTYSHKNLAESSAKEIDEELDKSIAILEKLKLIDDTTRTFAAPNGALNDLSRDKVKQRFALARNVKAYLGDGVDDRDINLKQGFDQYRVVGYTIRQDTTISELREAIAFTKANNGWFIPIYHQIDESDTVYAVSPKVFETQLKLFKDSDIKISTVRNVAIHNKEYVR